jgi:hypothetical protein
VGKPENVWSSHHTRDCPNNINPSGKDLVASKVDRYYTGSGGYGTLGKSFNDENRMDEDDPRDLEWSSSSSDEGRS